MRAIARPRGANRCVAPGAAGFTAQAAVSYARGNVHRAGHSDLPTARAGGRGGARRWVARSPASAYKLYPTAIQFTKQALLPARTVAH